MVTVLNGRLDGALLSAIPNGRLRHDAAASWLRVLAEGVEQGYVFVPSGPLDSYRPYATQERIFRERYTTSWVTGIDPRRWLGEVWWRKPGTAAAAVPGTSNHGLGVAIDVAHLGGFTGDKYRALARIAGKHGWDNVSGRRINEPWHWEYKRENDLGAAAPTPPPPAATKTPPVIDLFGGDDIMFERALVAAYRTHLGRTPGAAEVDERILRIAADDNPLARLRYEINDIAVSPEAKAHPVVTLYRQLLGRLPSDAEVSYWLTAAKGDPAQIEAGIKGSEEYARLVASRNG